MKTPAVFWCLCQLLPSFDKHLKIVVVNLFIKLDKNSSCICVFVFLFLWTPLMYNNLLLRRRIEWLWLMRIQVKRLECSKDAKEEDKRPKGPSAVQLEVRPLKLASSLLPSMMMMMIRTNLMVCTLQISHCYPIYRIQNIWEVSHRHNHHPHSHPH